MPASLVGRADQASRQMRWVIRRPVEVRAVSSCLLMQEPAGSMIPWHKTVVEKEMAVSRRGHPVFVRGTTQMRNRRQFRQVATHSIAKRLRQERNTYDSLHLRDWH